MEGKGKRKQHIDIERYHQLLALANHYTGSINLYLDLLALSHHQENALSTMAEIIAQMYDHPQKAVNVLFLNQNLLLHNKDIVDSMSFLDQDPFCVSASRLLSAQLNILLEFIQRKKIILLPFTNPCHEYRRYHHWLIEAFDQANALYFSDWCQCEEEDVEDNTVKKVFNEKPFFSHIQAKLLTIEEKRYTGQKEQKKFAKACPVCKELLLLKQKVGE